MGDRDQLQATVDSLVQAGKGILAVDESGAFISGVILYEETLGQRSDDGITAARAG